jgi:hypothetical protein
MARRLVVMLAVVAGVVVGAAVPAFADVTTSPTTVPATPSTTGPGLGSTGHGAGFVVIAVVLVAALLFSTWRLRRGR